MEMEPRRRLKKLKSEPVPESNGLIPKKKNLPNEKILKSPDEEEDSLDDFISDRVEYMGRGPPSSSEESAHSTDEEHYIKKKKKIRESSSESSDKSSASEALSDEDLSSSGPVKNNEEEVLVGREALEAKRKQGLIPYKKPKKKEKNREKDLKKKTKKRVEEEPERKKTEKSSKNKDPKKYVQFSEFSEKDRKKAEVVTKVLQRWWYALDEWPPHDFDYGKALFERKLRLVVKENWSVEPVVDDRGLEKVMNVPGYPGLFINHIGNIEDLRPAHLCPSFDNLFSKPFHEVKEILVRALSNQIEQLKVQPKYDRELLRDLTKELAYYQKQI
jgi:hypothetical protein